MPAGYQSRTIDEIHFPEWQELWDIRAILYAETHAWRDLRLDMGLNTARNRQLA